MAHQDEIRDAAMRLLSYDRISGFFTWKESRRGSARAGDIAGYRNPQGYIRIGVGSHKIHAHRLAWLVVHGKLPALIDHIDGNPSNNAIENLRLCTTRGNSENRRIAGPRKCGGRLLGAHWNKTWRRWHSSICTAGKQKHLGWFDTEQQAHAAYVLAKREQHAGCTI